jgi:hypothetical protein
VLVDQAGSRDAGYCNEKGAKTRRREEVVEEGLLCEKKMLVREQNLEMAACVHGLYFRFRCHSPSAFSAVGPRWKQSHHVAVAVAGYREQLVFM